MTRHLLFGLLLCALVGCLYRDAFAKSQQAQLSEPQADPTTGLIMEVQGKVRLKPKGVQKFVPVQIGTQFRRGDVLQIGAAAQATVVCADLQKHDLLRGIHGLPCQPGNNNALYYDGSKVIPTRSDTLDSGFPLILSPRKTKLLGARPTLRWKSVAGASTYQVSVRGRNLNWRKEVGSVTELVYPEDAPRLMAGETYKLTVVANDRSSDDEGLAGLGFTLLEADEAQAVREAEGKIRALSLPDTAIRFLIACLYTSQGRNAEGGLNAEAIEQLEGSPEILGEPAVLRLLGDLYLRIGLNRQAEDRYLKAVRLSQRVNDVGGEALAQDALGRLYYEAFGNQGAGIQRLQRAVELYKRLGDWQTVKRLQQRLAEMRKQ